VDELIQLIVFALIIIASMAEAGARKRKAQRRQSQERARTRAPRPIDEPDWEPVREEGIPETGAPTFESTKEQMSAETMVPRDLWEEIEAMARGQEPIQAKTASDPETGFELPAEPGRQGPAGSGAAQEPSLWDLAEDLRDEEAMIGRRVAPPDLQRPERGSPRLSLARSEAKDQGRGEGPVAVPPETRGVPLGTPADLRRAILAREIFGRPRGLAPGRALPMEEG
jgi:hypothetical protein